MPLPDPSATGFTNSGNGSGMRSRSATRSMTRNGAVGTPRYARISLVRPLCSVSASVSGSEPVRNVQVLAQRGDVRLATGAVQSLRHVEDDVGTCERELLRKELVGFETDDVAEETQSLTDRVDGGRVIPFCVGVRCRAGVGFLVVCETNSHAKNRIRNDQQMRKRETTSNKRRRKKIVEVKNVETKTVDENRPTNDVTPCGR